MAPAAKWRSLLIKVSVTLVTFSFFFLVGEGIVRGIFKERTVLFPRYHTGYQYGHYRIRGIRPNSTFWHRSVDGAWEFTTNNKGFRSAKDHEYDKPDGVLRVLSLGDSHTQGYEVRQEHTFSAVLERFLSKSGIEAEVINAGVSGFSTAEALVLLENEGFRYQPDVVLLGFYANDLEDNLKAGLFGLDDEGGLLEKKREHLPGVDVQDLVYAIPGVPWLSENSYFYSLLFNTVWNQFKERQRVRAIRSAPNRADAEPEYVTEVEFAVPRQDTYTAYEVTLAGALIARMDEACKRNGVRFFVVDIPSRVSEYQFKSSLPTGLMEYLSRNQTAVLTAELMLGEFAGVGQFHVPNGHRHISEFTHTIIGAKLGQAIVESDN